MGTVCHTPSRKVSAVAFTQLPVEHDVVWEEGGQQQFDEPDGQPQHEQHDGAEHHHRQNEAPQVSVDGKVNHLLHWVEVGVIEVSKKPQYTRSQDLNDKKKKKLFVSPYFPVIYVKMFSRLSEQH